MEKAAQIVEKMFILDLKEDSTKRGGGKKEPRPGVGPSQE